jgi:hypothetical protein
MSWCAGERRGTGDGRKRGWHPRYPPRNLCHATHPAGFTASFWRGYFAVAPKAPLFEMRKDLYTLYHILNVGTGGGVVFFGEAVGVAGGVQGAPA